MFVGCIGWFLVGGFLGLVFVLEGFVFFLFGLGLFFSFFFSLMYRVIKLDRLVVGFVRDSSFWLELVSFF